MAYDGYFKFGGVEIVNAARVTKYVGSLMPTFGLSDCTDCEGLRQAVGDPEYRTPALDPAPWLDSSNPRANDFWGVYPLGVSGMDDSTRQVAITELIGDGAVSSRPRAASREMRFDVMLVGKDDAAVDAGLHWLERALDAYRCGDRGLGCSGAALEFFSSCPPVCDYSGCPDVPVEPATAPETEGWQVSGDNPQTSWFEVFDCVPVEDGFGLWVNSGVLLPLRVTRVMTGLVPGAWYRVEVATTGWNSTVKVSARGANSEVDSPYAGADPCGDTALTTLWFQAHSPVMYLDFMTESADQFQSQQEIRIARLRVQRADPSADIYKTTWPNDGTYLNGWTTGATGGDFAVDVIRDALTIGTDSQYTDVSQHLNFPAASASIPEGFDMMSRSIRGLVPGRRYRVRLMGAIGQNGVTTEDYPIRLTLDGLAQEEQVILGADIATDIFSPFQFMMDFTAQGTSQGVTIGAGTGGFNLSEGGVEEVQTFLFYFSVEEIQEGFPPLPDAADDYRRTLYRTTAITGPVIEERYNRTCGSMIRVSFGLNAGVPHQFGPITPAGSALGGSSSPLDQVECVGQESVRHNLIPNPSWETTTDAWTVATEQGSTYQRVDVGSASAQAGSYVARLTPGAGAPNESVQIDTAPGGHIPVIGGALYTLSGSVRRSGGVTGTTARLIIAFYDATDTAILYGSAGTDWTPIANEQWDRLSLTVRPPSNAEYAAVIVIFENLPNDGGAAWLSSVFWVDAVMLEPTGSLAPYFDGSYPDSAWDGVIGNSTSTFTPSLVSPLIDPDCPPLPPPPAPPSIEQDCIEFPTAWTRYTIYIPATEIPLYSSVLPIISISTGNSTARQLRMRWYPNPDGVGIDAIPPCEFEGEIAVSYVPPNAEMVVDTITREATASVNGGPEQPATTLLYGPDGGPMVWPELRCNQGYVFTVDVDAADDVSELDVRLALGLKV